MSIRTLRLPSALVAAAALILLLSTASGPTTAEPGLEQQVATLAERVAILEGEIERLTSRVQSNHPDAAMERAALEAFREVNVLLTAGQLEEAKPKFDAFMTDYGNTRAGQQARSLGAELAVIGAPAPTDWKIDSWFQGQDDIALDSDGPTVVVFWETWCPHCRREVPKLEQLQAEYGDRGLQILGLSRLSRNTTADAVRSFIDENDITFPMAKEDGTLSAHFAVGGIPAVAVVQDGRVIWRGHPARVNSTLIESWLR